VAMSEPVVVHHGREDGPFKSQRGAAVSCNSLLGGARRRLRACYRNHRIVTTSFKAESPNRPASEPQAVAMSRVLLR